MKNLIISLVTFLILFAIGCQENSVTDPTPIEPVNKLQKDIPEEYHSGDIILNSVLKDPYPVINSFYRITGQIEYHFSRIYFDPKLQSNQRFIALHLEVNADLQNVCTVCPPNDVDELSGFISEISDLILPVGGSTVSVLDKSFTINGRTDRMTLNVKFSVSKDRVEVTAMWLALPILNTEATKSN